LLFPFTFLDRGDPGWRVRRPAAETLKGVWLHCTFPPYGYIQKGGRRERSGARTPPGAGGAAMHNKAFSS